METIGILGSGMVGKALADGFLKYGHKVMVGSSDTTKLDDWLSSAGPHAQTGDFIETSSFGDLIVLACKGSATRNVLETSGSQNLAGKIIIDATNPIADEPPEKGILKYFTSFDRSLMEELQESFPEAHFVKSFSVIGSHLMVNPDFGGIRPSMFICGNNEEAKAKVATILDKFGFEIEDMGDAEAARAIEPLAILWCIPGFRENKWNHAFKLLRQ